MVDARLRHQAVAVAVTVAARSPSEGSRRVGYGMRGSHVSLMALEVQQLGLLEPARRGQVELGALRLGDTRKG